MHSTQALESLKAAARPGSNMPASERLMAYGVIFSAECAALKSELANTATGAMDFLNSRGENFASPSMVCRFKLDAAISSASKAKTNALATA